MPAAACATLGVTALQAQLPAGKSPLAAIARARCDSTQREADATQRAGVSTRRSGDVALAGVVREAVTTLALDSARVFAQWIDLTLDARGVTRSLVMRVARTDRDGVYVLCAVPGDGTLLVWAERDSATTSTIALTMLDVTTRFDISLDPTSRARATNDSADGTHDARALEWQPFPLGHSRYGAVVAQHDGRPLPGARVRTLGHEYVMSDDRGAVTLDSLPRGPATLEILAIGYVPEQRLISVGSSGAPPDTIVMTSLRSTLDTIRVTAGRDQTGFDRRRKGQYGHFLTAADIEREKPGSTTGLLRTKVGLRYTFDGRGDPIIEMSGGPGAKCSPYVFVDGFPAAPMNRVVGIPMMNRQITPDEIGGVEYYLDAMQIPPEFLRWIFGPPPACGAIAFWTRERLGLPKMPKPASAPDHGAALPRTTRLEATLPDRTP